MAAKPEIPRRSGPRALPVLDGVIDALASEGHAIVPGAIGENVTLSGLSWSSMKPGARLRIGSVDVEVTAFAVPCRSIEAVFVGRRIARIAEKANPG